MSMAMAMAPISSPATFIQRSPWHSPVPYLFGGLAAMMALIVFALCILACSYWKLSRNLQVRDLEAGHDVKPDSNKIPTVFEETYLVVMAGDEKPTFLATPSSSRTSSFGSKNCPNCSSESEMEKDESDDRVQVSPLGSNGSGEEPVLD